MAETKTIKGKTESGFEYTISSDIIDNWELLESLQGVDNGEKYAFLDVLKCILPDKADRDRLKEHCRNENGIVSTKSMVHEIVGIFKSQNAKNS